MKKRLIYILSTLIIFSLLSCNSWLDLQPINEQTTERYWESKEEVEAVLASTYKQLRSCLQKFVYWGDLRGDGVSFVLNATDDAAKIVQLDILPNNSVNTWGSLYTAIGYANSVLKYGSTALENDPRFVQAELNAIEAEAIFLRSLCYFYLIRTFGEVPLVLEPYVDDSVEYTIPSSSEDDIITQILQDLTSYKAKCKTGYESDDPDSWMNTGRVNRFAYSALLADIYLWVGRYGDCIKECDELINAGKYELLGGSEWFKLFYPGNSIESIFELPYSYISDNETNSLYTWFYNGTSTSYFVASGTSIDLYTQYSVTDLRGIGTSYEDGTNKLWKFVATDSKANGGGVRSYRDCNWIFYRYSEILLFKAEALIMQENISDAFKIIAEIRERAGYTAQVEIPESKYEALVFLMEERQREFLGEGKRWFDILRVAKRNNYEYKEYLLNVLLANVSAKDYANMYSKLQNPYAYYLPIHKDEIENGKGILKQNPYYERFN